MLVYVCQYVIVIGETSATPTCGNLVILTVSTSNKVGDSVDLCERPM